jgi:hypothetical protein
MTYRIPKSSAVRWRYFVGTMFLGMGSSLTPSLPKFKRSVPNLVRASTLSSTQLLLAVALSGMPASDASCTGADANCRPLRPQPTAFDGLENGTF